MRSAVNVLWRVEDRRRVAVTPTPLAPKSFSHTPVLFVPHPPLVSGGWYRGAGQEVAGPGRYPVARPADKTAGAALLWTFFFGPLGLGYLSTTAGVLATALSAGVLVIAGSTLTLAVIWPLVMIVSVVAATNRR